MIRLLLGLVLLAVLAGCESVPRQVLPFVMRDTEVNASLDLYLYDLQVGSSRLLRQTTMVDEIDPAIDPMGQRVAYITRKTTTNKKFYNLRVYALCVYDLRTGRTQEIMRSGDLLSSPVFSNNGKKLAYAAQREGRLQIEVYELDGTSEPKTITFGSNPSWRVDDRALFYNSRDALDADHGNLMVYDLKTGLNQSLALRGNGFRNLSRGTSIVYTALPYSRRNEAVWVININSRQTRLSSPGKAYRDHHPVHINGTKFIAFTRTEVETNKSSIFVVERYAEDPVEALLFEANGNASTSGEERLADQQG